MSLDRFLPRENDAEAPCLADPLEEGGVQVSRGLLKVELRYWLSCGSSSVYHHIFSFRYESQRFRLIGMGAWEFMRNSGDRSEYSINYLTGKQKITTGLNEFEVSQPKISWRNVAVHRNFYLDEMTSSCYSEDKVEDWCQPLSE